MRSRKKVGGYGASQKRVIKEPALAPALPDRMKYKPTLLTPEEIAKAKALWKAKHTIPAILEALGEKAGSMKAKQIVGEIL